jgi:glycosyltransferase involved in cell wall biosynthesis
MNGWLVPPDDPAALQTAVLGLLADPNVCALLGRAAREHVVRNYDLSATAQSLHELYEQLKRKAGQPASAISEVSG